MLFVVNVDQIKRCTLVAHEVEYMYHSYNNFEMVVVKINLMSVQDLFICICIHGENYLDLYKPRLCILYQLVWIL